MKKIVFLVVLVSIFVPIVTNAQVLRSNPGDPGYATQIPSYGASNPSIVTSSGPSSLSTSSGACSGLDTKGLGGVVGCILSIFSSLIVLMIAGGVVFVVYGAFLMMTNEEKRAEGKNTVMYGIIGIFVMVSVWGLVNILKSTFSLSNTPIDPPKLTK